jgi:hypothetical protein
MDFFRQSFRGDAVFCLMSELNQDSGGWFHPESAFLKVNLLGRGDQLELLLRAGSLGQHHRSLKQQEKGKKKSVSLFH